MTRLEVLTSRLDKGDVKEELYKQGGRGTRQWLAWRGRTGGKGEAVTRQRLAWMQIRIP